MLLPHHLCLVDPSPHLEKSHHFLYIFLRHCGIYNKKISSVLGDLHKL